MTQGEAGGNPKPNIRVREFIYTKPYKGEIVEFCYILILSCLLKKLELHETFLEIENLWLTNAEDRSVAQEVGIHTRVGFGAIPLPWRSSSSLSQNPPAQGAHLRPSARVLLSVFTLPLLSPTLYQKQNVHSLPTLIVFCVL